MTVSGVIMAAIVALAGVSAAGAAATPGRWDPPLRNPAVLNIGFVCRWQDRCITRQKGAMVRSLSYVETYRPPTWRIQQCNRNASRGGTRVDWIGFDNCVRNAGLRPSTGKRRR
ncbi:MAG: hypothetical protein ABIW18_05925 [Sphingomicrobium sp.]